VAGADVLATLRVAARRHARLADEAEDLLQDALLAAVRVGRADLASTDNLRWLHGTIRQLGTMHARAAVRRLTRESAWSAEQLASADDAPDVWTARVPEAWRQHPAIATLRLVALLALAGHDREEIAWLLGLGPVALRQRISTLRKRLRHSASDPSAAEPASADDLPVGLIRRALLPVVRSTGGLGVADPDGHLLSVSRPGAHVSRIGGNRGT
jgi:DNA-directed RNA polymerase specialized sigma24 family protein